jgi:hypothetical protein
MLNKGHIYLICPFSLRHFLKPRISSTPHR